LEIWRFATLVDGYWSGKKVIDAHVARNGNACCHIVMQMSFGAQNVHLGFARIAAFQQATMTTTMPMLFAALLVHNEVAAFICCNMCSAESPPSEIPFCKCPVESLDHPN